MKFVLRAGFLISIILLITGCSQDGDVKVVNNCNTTFTGELNNEAITIDPGESYSENVYIGKRLVVIGPDSYDIELSGSAWTKKEFSTTITVKTNETTTYTIDDDIGAIKLTNDYIKDIIELRIKKCSDTEYGDKLINDSHPLKPGKFFLIKKNAGCWDIYLKYGRAETEDTLKNIETQVGVITEVSWNPTTE